MEFTIGKVFWIAILLGVWLGLVLGSYILDLHYKTQNGRIFDEMVNQFQAKIKEKDDEIKRLKEKLNGIKSRTNSDL